MAEKKTHYSRIFTGFTDIIGAEYHQKLSCILVKTLALIWTAHFRSFYVGEFDCLHFASAVTEITENIGQYPGRSSAGDFPTLTQNLITMTAQLNVTH